MRAPTEATSAIAHHHVDAGGPVARTELRMGHRARALGRHAITTRVPGGRAIERMLRRATARAHCAPALPRAAPGACHPLTGSSAWRRSPRASWRRSCGPRTPPCAEALHQTCRAHRHLHATSATPRRCLCDRATRRGAVGALRESSAQRRRRRDPRARECAMCRAAPRRPRCGRVGRRGCPWPWDPLGGPATARPCGHARAARPNAEATGPRRLWN
mmetsp:Transcript_98612/g.274478  ORF Transcript_98612/g.274478 Transcript_98612/m.274478 type:complete len:217 (-) Transcript_98612:44-694(-)